jgi:uncharacterized NAD(P)/FAD-binding protein YdhS
VDTGVNFTIVGGGLTATAMLIQFVGKVRRYASQRQWDPSIVGIQIFEKHNVFGPGFPHNDNFILPFHITNMCASDMGILDEEPNDFQLWVIKNSEKLMIRFPWFQDDSQGADRIGNECNHYPRAIMGEYLKSRFQAAVQMAAQVGLRIHLYPSSEVVDIKHNDNKLCLCVRDLSDDRYFSSYTDHVLLATGHWSEKGNQENYFHSPWPADKLRRNIPENAKIAVIGTSLSAIETLLTLTSDGEFVRSPTGRLVFRPSVKHRTFSLYSRRGLLPKVRGKSGSRKNKYLNRRNIDRLLSENGGVLTLETIFNLLNSELEDGYGHPIDWQEVMDPSGKPVDLLQKYLIDAIQGDGPDGELIWQTILVQSFDIVKDIYLNLSAESRRQFDKNYTSVFFTHAASQPVVNAEKLLALMQAGIVQVRKLGKNYRLIKNSISGRYEFIYKDDRGKLMKDAFRYVVNARGQQKSLGTNPSALVKNLIQSGTLQIEKIQSVGSTADDDPNESIETKILGSAYTLGSLLIDPETHRVLEVKSDKEAKRSNCIYAVGAMTRGQIINASMARGIVQATSKVADDLLKNLIRVYEG